MEIVWHQPLSQSWFIDTPPCLLAQPLLIVLLAVNTNNLGCGQRPGIGTTSSRELYNCHGYSKFGSGPGGIVQSSDGEALIQPYTYSYCSPDLREEPGLGFQSVSMAVPVHFLLPTALW